ncbi:MAG: phage shock protein E [Myxococcota bacterium]|jgi:phage shock protein E
MSLWKTLFGGGTGDSATARVSGTQARQLVTDGALLLDVRTPTEFGGGHLPDALNVPVGQLARRMDEIPQDRPIVVYCRSGARSSRAAGMLSRNSRGPIHDLGPMSAW